MSDGGRLPHRQLFAGLRDIGEGQIHDATTFMPDRGWILRTRRYADRVVIVTDSIVGLLANENHFLVEGLRRGWYCRAVSQAIREARRLLEARLRVIETEQQRIRRALRRLGVKGRRRAPGA